MWQCLLQSDRKAADNTVLPYQGKCVHSFKACKHPHTLETKTQFFHQKTFHLLNYGYKNSCPYYYYNFLIAWYVKTLRSVTERYLIILTSAARCYWAICVITLGRVCYSLGTKLNMRMLSVFTLQMKVWASGMQMNNSRRALMGVTFEDNNFVLWCVSVHACRTKSWIVREGSKWPKSRHSFTCGQHLRISKELTLRQQNTQQMWGKETDKWETAQLAICLCYVTHYLFKHIF